MSGVYEPLSEEECYLYALFQDYSGIDIAEFCLIDEEFKENDGLVRAFDFQWHWWRCNDKHQIDQGSRSLGKSMSIRYRAVACPFVIPGASMLVTAPEGVHLQPIESKIETIYRNNRIPREMLAKRGNQPLIRHRPFEMVFENGGVIMGRIPHHDGGGVKGCIAEGELILTDKGYIPVEDLQAGDNVLNRDGQFVPVDHIQVGYNDVYEVKGAGSFPIKVSEEHLLLGAYNLAGPKQKRMFSPLSYTPSRSLVEDVVHWASPTKFEKLEVEYPHFENTHKLFNPDCENFWWVVGRYIADGHLMMDRKNNKAKRVQLSVHPKDHAEVFKRINGLGLNYSINKRAHSTADLIDICSAPLYNYLQEHYGHLAGGKTMPAFVLGMSENYRQSLLDGYLSGDGSYDATRDRWTLSSASKRLAVAMQMLGQSLGYSAQCSVVQPKQTHIQGVPLKNTPQLSWRVSLVPPSKSTAAMLDDYLLYKVKSVEPVGKMKVYNPIVVDGHTYLSGSIMHHNQHPTWLEQDEASDYPEAGWTELNNTIAKVPDAMWRAHGVTRGIGGTFDGHCKPDSGWTVHRLPAMLRPTWDDEERAEMIMKYGSEENPDYRRNVLGLPGDSSSALFVLSRLMRCVDDDLSSTYNEAIYYMNKIDDGMIEEVGNPLMLLNFPASHMKFKNFWMGMDVGWTTSPSAICIFAEERDHKKEQTALRLLTRLMLTRVSGPDQIAIIMHLVEMYRPLAFALDSTGAGQPLVQFLQREVRKNPEIKLILERIKGYNFSSNIIVDFDETVEIDDNDPDTWKEAQMQRNVKDYSSDLLRELVDEKRLILPYDMELIKEFQLEQWSYSRSIIDAYGKKKIYAGSGGHTLDACRMAALGYKQNKIDQMIKNHEESWEPPPMIFL